jgi:hypothetical protein
LHELPGSSRTADARLIKADSVTVETCWSIQLPVRVNYQLKFVCSFLRGQVNQGKGTRIMVPLVTKRNEMKALLGDPVRALRGFFALTI